jgi:hypothetical protein
VDMESSTTSRWRVGSFMFTHECRYLLPISEATTHRYREVVLTS